MCNLFNQTTAKEAMRRVFSDLPWQDMTGNLGPADIYPDRPAAIVRASAPAPAYPATLVRVSASASARLPRSVSNP